MGSRHRCGERISTGFVESTINQLVTKRFVKQHQMRWTPRGAHLLLQVAQVLTNSALRFGDDILNSVLTGPQDSPGRTPEKRISGMCYLRLFAAANSTYWGRSH